MDHRTPLKFHTVLVFEGMSCHVEEVIGQGSNAIVYKGWYPDHLNCQLRHSVLIKELFPRHPRQMIRRNTDGTILVEPEARAFWELHRCSFEAGNEIHLRLLEAHPHWPGTNLNSFAHNGTLYSILGYTGGRSLYAELSRSSPELRSIVTRMLALLDALEAFHKSGYLHLDISPDNIMLTGSPEKEQLFLIDYNRACRLTSEDSPYSSCEPGFSAPEVVTGNRELFDFSSDLYSVAAIFYYCLTGNTLTLNQCLQSRPPAAQDSPLLAQVPQTVSSMAGRILNKGLHTLPAKRYRTTGQMRRAFQELLDRIDCVGVTHWALWESGRRSVEDLIRINPSLGYLKERDLYPIRLEHNGKRSLDEYLNWLLSPQGASSLIVAQGGMGKTTLLLNSATLLGLRYSPSVPAVFYISLAGWKGTDPHCICSQILTRLRFKQGKNCFSSAMHALLQLLAQPLNTKVGPMPAVLLLLDGLNEIRGDIGPLIQEIQELTALAGVRILAASRSRIPELPLETVELMPLDAEDIEEILSSGGFLVPERSEMRQLLRTPLVLSLFRQACEADIRPEFHTEEELMQAYLEVLLQKELRKLPEDSPQRWQTDAALKLVLPAIAAEIRRTRGRSLTEAHLLRVIESCWKQLHSRTFKKTFPQWIGRSRDITGDVQTPEQWYGIMVHQLLWKRLGMLLQDTEGGWRIFHQTMEAYLASRRKTTFSVKKWLLPPLLLCCIALLFQFWHYRQNMQDAIEYAALGYWTSGSLYSQLRQTADHALGGNGEAFFDSYDKLMPVLNAEKAGSVSRSLYRSDIIENFDSTGQILVSWSLRPFDCALALELLDHTSEQAEYYTDVLPSLAGWMHSETLQKTHPDLPLLVSQVLEADAALTGRLYQQVCAIHLPNGDRQWAENIESLSAELTALAPYRLSGSSGQAASVEDCRIALRNAKGTLETQLMVIHRQVQNQIYTLEQNLTDIRQAADAAGIDTELLHLDSMRECADMLAAFAWQ